jgi:hypothetical protein
MSDFDPDAYLAASAGFDPDAYLADAPKAKAGPSALRSGVLGIAQGGTAGFAEELAAKAVDMFGGGGVRPGKQAPAELREEINATPTLGALLKARMRQESKDAAETHPETYLPGEILGNIGLSIAGGNALGLAGKYIKPLGKAAEAFGRLKPLTQAVTGGVGQGAAYGAGTSEAEGVGGILRDTAIGGVIGATGGAAGHGIARGLGAGGKLLQRLGGRKAEQMTGKIDDLAREATDETTRSARSGAGTSATDAYKQAEHTLSLPPGRASPEKIAKANALLEERALKAADKLEDSAARKEAQAAVYREALDTAESRTAEHAKRIGNPANQLKPRLKRYALPIAGGLAGLALGEGNPLSAGAGLLAGRGISPTVQALARMAKHPSVQRPLWQALEKLGRGAQASEPATRALARPASRVAQMEIDDRLIQLLAGMTEEDESDAKGRALAGALGR